MEFSHFATTLLARGATGGDKMTGQDGPVSGGSLPRQQTIFAVVAFTTVALYNVIELTCIIFTTFKKRRGLYFISFCVATWGIPPYAISFLILGIHPPDAQSRAIYGYVTGIVVGWICTVSGQSVVLYSRLHLIDRDRRHLRCVLAMIITNGVVLHTATTVMVFGANSIENPSRFYKPYSIMEKVQVSVFFVQVSLTEPCRNSCHVISHLTFHKEFIISLLYIVATINFFRHSALHAASTRARMLRQLIAINILVVILDITILGLEFADLYKLQTAYKAMAYSIKLKLEFSILNSLVNITRDRASSSSVSGGADYVFDGSRRSNLSTTLNATSTRDAADVSRSEGGRKRGSFQAVAEYFACARRASRGQSPPEGVIVRTTDMDIEHHDASERPMEAP